MQPNPVQPTGVESFGNPLRHPVGAEAEQLFHGEARLLDWAELSGAYPADDLAALRREAAVHPRAASRALARVKELRETLWELLTAAVAG